jgi:histidyl-tRNA synthetase
LNGGGRYDGLAEVLGGLPTPAIGFGAGIERIIQELKRQGITPPQQERTRIFVVYLLPSRSADLKDQDGSLIADQSKSLEKTTELKDVAVQITASLRRAGIKSEMSYGGRSRKAQMRQANNSGAAYAVLLKEEELSNDLVTIKDMQAEEAGSGVPIGSQVQVKREALIEHLKSLLRFSHAPSAVASLQK